MIVAYQVAYRDRGGLRYEFAIFRLESTARECVAFLKTIGTDAEVWPLTAEDMAVKVEHSVTCTGYAAESSCLDASPELDTDVIVIDDPSPAVAWFFAPQGIAR